MSETKPRLKKDEKHNIGYEITMEVVLKGNIEDTFPIEGYGVEHIKTWFEDDVMEAVTGDCKITKVKKITLEELPLES